MGYSFDYTDYTFQAFWSNEVNKLIKELRDTKTKSHATHHDMGLKFINENLFNGKGEVDKRKREKGKIYYDLKVPSRNGRKTHYFIEFKLYSSKLKNLKKVLDQRERVFATNDYLYFSYFLQRKWKDKTKILKTHICIYYLVVIILPKKVESIELKELLNNIKRDAKDFIERLAEESDVDLEDEEFLGVDNMIKVIDLERELEEIEKLYKKEIEEKEKTIEEKEKEIERLKKQLRKI